MRTGNDRFKGMSIYKVFSDHLGLPHEGGGLYAVFDNGWLIGEYFSTVAAEQAFLKETPRQDIHMKSYKGIDDSLK
jgi:hypothetical protein